MKLPFYLFIGMLFIFVNCNNKSGLNEANYPPTDTIRTSYYTIADSISYGVVIRNRDTTNKWQKKWLSHLEKDLFINSIFEAIYNKDLKAYDYFSDEAIPVRKIKELEKKQEFDRSRIGKIQFEEVWYFDPDDLKMVKAVNSIMLAYEVYRQDSTFRGYKPAFKVYLNKPFNRKNH